MPRPYPQINITEPNQILSYPNTVTGGVLGTLFVVACGIILFFLLKQKYEKTSISIALSCLLTMIISSFMWALGLVQGRFIVLLLVITALTTIWAIFER